MTPVIAAADRETGSAALQATAAPWQAARPALAGAGPQVRRRAATGWLPLGYAGLPPGCSGLQRAGRPAPRAPSPVLAANTKRSARFLPSAHSAGSASCACSGSHWVARRWWDFGGGASGSLSRRREYELWPSLCVPNPVTSILKTLSLYPHFLNHSPFRPSF